MNFGIAFRAEFRDRPFLRSAGDLGRSMALRAFHGRFENHARHPIKGECDEGRADQRERDENEMRDWKKNTDDRSAPAES